jgi:hypothetical protein
LYAIHKACVLYGLLPPGVKGSPSWDENNVAAQAEMLAFSQIREIESIGCPLLGSNK